MSKAIAVVEFLSASSMVNGSGKGMRRVTCVAAPVQAAHIHDGGLGPLSFDLQRRNERVFSVNDHPVGASFDSKPNSELR
jgi:hypothetical protein